MCIRDRPYVVGIDIGGTNTVFGIVDARGTIIASSSIKTSGYPTVEEMCIRDRIREMERDRKIVKLDLRSKSIFSSPYYYIRQNDIIYVTPSDRKINMRLSLIHI